MAFNVRKTLISLSIGLSVGLVLGGIVGGFLGRMDIGLALGALIGAGLGLMRAYVVASTPKEVVFTTGLIALAAKMARVDGVVVPAEVFAFDRVLDIPSKERSRVDSLFRLAQQSTLGFEAYARQIYTAFKDQPTTRADALEALCSIAAADGVIHPKEQAYLEAVAAALEVPGSDKTRIFARFLQRRDNPYIILGIEPDASRETIKKAYYALVKAYHPDRLVARGVPPEAVRLANTRLSAINEAYKALADREGVGV
jgi:DnaJ like chaperone protein